LLPPDRNIVARGPVGPGAPSGEVVRILQVITDTDRRGAQVFATDLGAGLERRGHDVMTVALGPGRHKAGLDHEVLGPRRRSFGGMRRLRELMACHDVAVAHGSTTLPVCAVAGLGVPTPWVYRQISESLFWASNPGRRVRVAAGLSRASMVVTLADSQGAVLAEHFGVPRHRLRVVPNGVPSERFVATDAHGQRLARTALDIDPEAAVVAYVGALVPEKGVDLAIEATAALPGVHLVVAGDGEQRRALEQMAARSAPERVHFVGVIPEVVTAYHAADVVVLPSRGGDSMPATLIEAGMCGRPTVATDVGAIAEVIESGITGEIVPTGDARRLARATQRLLADRAALAAMGGAARARCLARFDIDVVACQWEAALIEASSFT
jgi:glycosyltransferase involved in cell wall biosynthesis